MHRVANSLHALGIGPGDVVSFILPNLIDAHAIFWGAQAAGIVNPINFLLGPEQIAAILNTVGAKVLFTLGPRPDFDVWAKIVAVRARVPCLEAVILLDGKDDPANGIHGFEALLARAPDRELIGGRTIAPGDTATIFHTSGSTGCPKLVRHTHHNEVYAALSTALLFGFGSDDVVTCGLPLFHVAGSILMSLAPLGSGAQVLIPTPMGMREPLVLKNFWRIVERHGVTVPGGVPTSLLDLTQVPVGSADISAARFALTGGAPLPTGLAQRFFEHCGLQTRQVYGMTETAGIIAGAPPGMQSKPGQLGLCAPFVQLKIMTTRPDGTRRDCGPQEKGEIYVRGPNVGAYIDEEEAKEQDNSGWLDTGDIGSLDVHGVLSVSGRTKDVIIRSGHNIEPAMIEEAAERHPAVKSCAAVGQPDKRAGEVPVLFVTLQPGADTNADLLKDFVCAQVAEPPAKPVELFIVTTLPLNAVGKISRPKLRCEAIRRVLERELTAVAPVSNMSCRVSVELDENSRITSVVRIESAAGSTATHDELASYVQRVRDKLEQYSIDFSIEQYPAGVA